MAVKIGHASIDENGKVAGGKAGDQTAKEVCTRDWYADNWSVLLRPKKAAVAEKMAKFCEKACANSKIGYDQYQRNTLRTKAKAAKWDASKITEACETDCSAFMTVCAEAAGLSMDSAYTSGNAPTTHTMRAKFKATGEFDVLTDSKYLTSSNYLKRGDVLVKESGHTVMVLSDGSKVKSTTDSEATKTTTQNTTATKEIVHTVKKGDTLSAIANKYGTTVQKLAEYNNIKNPNQLSVGQKIKIPGKSTAAVKETLYTVKKGDTLSAIANKYGTTYKKLAEYNNIKNPNLLSVGQKIKIPKV